ncbi:hypothetical protein G9274_001110 [Stenotrophomonas rhizophila]|nr:hypothetical protein G9274_001110 [Stenotrophomonas rhizophila]
MVAVLMVDVDDFKKINDSHGHPAGDEVLKIVAKRCREALRERDLFARFGGEGRHDHRDRRYPHQCNGEHRRRAG